MKKVLLVVIAPLLVCALFIFSFAHGGRTDSSGGHYNRSTGEYHYHHGYSAHSHYDIDGDGTIDCPYDFDDTTSHGSSRIERPTETKKVYDPREYLETTAKVTESEAKETFISEDKTSILESIGDMILYMGSYIFNIKLFDLPLLLFGIAIIAGAGYCTALILIGLPCTIWEAVSKKVINYDVTEKIIVRVGICLDVIFILCLFYFKAI